MPTHRGSLRSPKKTAMVEYKESDAYKANLANGNVEATEIDFNCLYNRLASDHPTMHLSCYTLAKLLEVSTPEDDMPSGCPPTPSTSIVHSLKTLLIIHEDRPFEAAKVEAGIKLDTFV